MRAVAALRRGGSSDQPGDGDARPGEPPLEHLQVLPGQDRGGRGDQHLPARQGSAGRGAQRDLGLAEAHVAAHQAVHGSASGQVRLHGVDGRPLAGCQRVGEAAVQGCRAGAVLDGGSRDGGAGGGGLRKLGGGGLHLRLHLGPAAAPGLAADMVRGVAVAAQAPDAAQVPGRDQQLGLVGEAHRQAFLPVHHPQGMQAGDAMVIVHHQVAQPGRVGIVQGGMGGACAQQGADGQDQQAGRAQAFVDVEQNYENAGLGGPGVGGVGVQATAGQAGGDAGRVGPACGMGGGISILRLLARVRPAVRHLRAQPGRCAGDQVEQGS